MNSKKSQRGMPAVREPRASGRRDPRVEEGAALPTHPPVPGELLARARVLARESIAPDVVAELAQEREARARDAAMLGEMFMRVCDADAKRRTADLAAEALSQRIATLEAELHEARTQKASAQSADAERVETIETQRALETLRGELETITKRAGGLEAELARLVRKTGDLERDRAIARRAEDEAMQQVATLRAEVDAVRARMETQQSTMAATVRAALTELEAEEARVAEARRRTFSDARQLLERAEQPNAAAPVDADAHEPSVKISGTAKVAGAGREPAPTPLASPRAQRAVATTAAALPRPRVAAAVPPSRALRPMLADLPAVVDADREKKS